MTKIYHPNQGDIVYLNFADQPDAEYPERCPALVVSSNYLNQMMDVVMICPISNSPTEFPLHLQLPSDLQTSGKILCEHLRSVDSVERQMEFVEALDKDTLAEALEIIANVLEIN